MPSVTPFVFSDPQLVLDPEGDAIELQCWANTLGDTVEQSSEEWETFCGTGTTYGPPRRTLTGTFYVSYGSTGEWTALHALEGQTVDFELVPDANAAVSTDNPKMTGTVRVPAVPFLGRNVSPGKAATFDLELRVEGEAAWVTSEP